MTDQLNKIFINDLKEPVLTVEQQAMRDYVESLPRVEVTETSILDTCVQRTGLSDFGPDDFRERLRIWLQDLEAANPMNLGRTILFENCVRYLSNRLRIEDTLKKHPEIHDIEIKKPVVVAGLQRSGTTHMVNMLAADKRFQSMSIWEQLELAAALQAKWSDNQVSITVTVPEHESDLIGTALSMYETRLKAVSFLPLRGDAVYKQAPYEQIDKAEYDKIVSKLGKVRLNPIADEDRVLEKFCDTDACEIPIAEEK